ncbi:DUF819 domain-containing protein [Sulfurimonas diazotrophicus]|uniref:DUF819 family protein n=1 Tax=Sulfurimonas diazotrophicus TaxID=3131939 RepID=A0ABZ3H7Z0_9BACT
MISSVFGYLGIVLLLGGGLWRIETRAPLKLFTWLPAIVLIYLFAIALSQSGLFAQNAAQTFAYKEVKSWLLPMMLFIMLLRLDLHAFLTLGSPLLLAYGAAVLSIAGAFFGIFALFDFGPEAAGVFGALGGSWTGGTANMLAVAAALGISEAQLGPALVVDSLLYTLWVSALLLAVPFARRFDRWNGANPMETNTSETSEGESNLRSILILTAIALLIASALRYIAALLPLLPESTWSVLLATLAGVAGSFTPMRRLGGSSTLASFLLYLLVALIGSHASLHGFSEVPRYLAAAASILILHAFFMLLIARLFRLSFFTIGVASLANIGGVASAPILAAAYNRLLIGPAVIMAVMGYLIGTLVGLLIASGLQSIAA